MNATKRCAPAGSPHPPCNQLHGGAARHRTPLAAIGRKESDPTRGAAVLTQEKANYSTGLTDCAGQGAVPGAGKRIREFEKINREAIAPDKGIKSMEQGKPNSVTRLRQPAARRWHGLCQ